MIQCGYLPASTDEHGSGLKGIGSGLKLIVAGSGLDQTEKILFF